MMDVGIRAVLSGWDAARNAIADTNREIEKTGASATKATTGGGSGDGLSGFSSAATHAAEATSVMRLAVVGAAAAFSAAGVTIAGVVAGTVDAVQRVSALGDQLHNLSQVTGFAVEQLGSMQLMASTSGMTIQQFAGGIQTFSRHIDEATKSSSKSAEAFERLGISIKNNDGTLKTSEQLLREVADRFSTMENGVTKTTLATQLFGGAANEMIPLLNQGSAGMQRLEETAKRAGIVLSTETAQAANELNENLAVLKAFGEGFWNSVAAPIIKGLAEMTRTMRAAREEGDGFFASMAKGVVKFFSGGAGDTQRQINQSQNYINSLEAKRAAGTITAAEEERLTASYATLQDLYRTLGVQQGETVSGDSGIVSFIPGERRPDKTRAGRKPPRDDTQQMIDQGLRLAMDAMDAEIKAARATSQEKIDLINAVLEADVGSNAVRMQLIKEREAAVDSQIKAEIRAQREQEKETKRIADADKAAMRDYDRIIEETVEKQIEALRRSGLEHDELIAKLQELREGYAAVGGMASTAVKKIDETIEKTTTNAEINARRIRSIFGDLSFDIIGVFDVMHRSFQQNIFAFAQGTQSLGETIKNIWRDVVDAVLMELSRLAANQMLMFMLGINPGGGGSSFNIGNVFGGGGGSAASGAINLFGGGGGGGSNIFSGASNFFSNGFGNLSAAADVLSSGGGFNAAVSTLMGGNAGVAAAGGAMDMGVGLNAVFGGGSAAGSGAGAATGGFGGMMSLGGLAGAGILALAAYGIMTDQKHAHREYRINGMMTKSGFNGQAFLPSIMPDGTVIENTNIQGKIDSVVRKLWPLGPKKNMPLVFSGTHIFTDSSMSDGRGDLEYIVGRAMGISDDKLQSLYPDKGKLQSNADDNARGAATGTDSIFTSPELIRVGEAGPERVQVSPLAGAAHHRIGASGMSINIHGFSMLDAYSARRMMVELKRQLGL